MLFFKAVTDQVGDDAWTYCGGKLGPYVVAETLDTFQWSEESVWGSSVIRLSSILWGDTSFPNICGLGGTRATGFFVIGVTYALGLLLSKETFCSDSSAISNKVRSFIGGVWGRDKDCLVDFRTERGVNPGRARTEGVVFTEGGGGGCFAGIVACGLTVGVALFRNSKESSVENWEVVFFIGGGGGGGGGGWEGGGGGWEKGPGGGWEGGGGGGGGGGMTFGDGVTTPIGLVCTKGFPVLSTLLVCLTETPRSDCTIDYRKIIVYYLTIQRNQK